MASLIQRPCTVNWQSKTSGDPFTGEVQHVRGGSRAATIQSGALAPALTWSQSGAIASGGNVLFCVVPGRLNSVLFHHTAVPTLSGVQVTFYDSSTILGSGTGTISGAKILAPLNFPGGVSGGLIGPNTFLNLDIPFNSGLGVSAPSGAPGFTITYTTES
jgi:hypothetical protein